LYKIDYNEFTPEEKEMIKQLIINADDFGMCEGNSIGILLAHKNGMVTSTTCMMNMPYARFALEQAKHFPHLGVGVHLVLTVGKPLIEGAKSYTDQNGNFIRPKDYPDGNPHADEEELYNEWKAQIDKFIEITGHKPTHLDSHHHVHLLPWHLAVTKRLADEYDLPIRQREKVLNNYQYVHCNDEMYGNEATMDFLLRSLQEDDEILEIMCHPALLDQRLYDISSYHLPRMKELEILTSKQLKQFIEDNHIELINYSCIQKIKTSK